MTAVFRKSLGRNLLPVIVSASALLLAVLPAPAIIDATLQMQLGNPSNATADTNNHDHYLIQRPVEAIDYSDHLGQPNWASWDLTSGDVGSSGRSSDFYTDTNLPPNFFWVPGDPTNPFSGSGYDRGHMCPSGDRTTNTTYNDMVFFMSNIIPQASAQNEGIWANFETQCRTLADAGNEMLITCGPSSFTTNTLYSGHVTIPAYTWKIAVVVPLGAGTATNRITPSTQVIAVRIPNTDAAGSDPWQNYRTNVVAIESDTGYTFFSALPPNLATVLRNIIDGQTPPAPAITGFSPTSGTAGTSVVITGTNLVFATNLTFNGTSASFTIDSTAQITATVPAGASSGLIRVMTLGGTAASAGTFTVGSTTAADLAIASTHTGNFTQGDMGDTYTIIVTNTGNAASSGAVTVVDTLPNGLTATAISGAGWTTNLGTLTCTRADTLAAGTAYPSITVTVNVSASAPASVTNIATVSGGGDTNSANNTASDPTTISAAGAPDLAITATHTGNFTQGDTGDIYTITVNNAGAAASSGTVTVTDALPAGLTATAISGSGWTTNLATLTCTRTDALPAGSSYPPITVTLNVATNAPASVTNTATVSGGGDTNSLNNTASDPTTINLSSSGGGTVTLAGWDVSGQTTYGSSPLSPTTNAANLSVGGLTRGTGVGTGGTAAARAWGGNNWTDTSSAAAITANRFATFAVAANSGYKVSFASISEFDYRHSGTGPTNGLLQYQIGSGTFADIAALSYPSNTSSGGSLSPIDLSGISALQNVGPGTNVTFRIVNWGATGSSGTWYIFDVANSTALDFVVQGAVSPAASAPTAITGTATGIGASSATLNGAVDPNGQPATAQFQYGLTAGYGLTLPVSGSLSGTATQAVSATLPGLLPGTTYHFRVAATNVLGANAGQDQAFTTLTPIEAWRLQWFGTTTNSGAAADNAIATGDGMPNLLKYALGLNPLLATNDPVAGDISTGYLRLTAPRNPEATDVTFQVEVTSDVTTPSWTTNGTTVDTDTSTLLQVHANPPVASSDGDFMRLRVSRP